MSSKLGAAVFVAVACAFGPMTAGAEDANRIEIADSDSTSTHACTPGTVVEVTGASNTVTLTGECKSITVSGASNKLKAEAVGAITVTGSDNAVTWKRGLGKSKPKVSRTGVNNKVTQEK